MDERPRPDPGRKRGPAGGGAALATPIKGVKLSSYAVYWIRAYILKYILDNMRSVRLGTTRASRKLFFRLNKEKRALERQGFEVEPKLLAERLDVRREGRGRHGAAPLGSRYLSTNAPAAAGRRGRHERIGDSFSPLAARQRRAAQVGDLRAAGRAFLEQVEEFVAVRSEERDRKHPGRAHPGRGAAHPGRHGRASSASPASACASSRRGS